MPFLGAVLEAASPTTIFPRQTNLTRRTSNDKPPVTHALDYTPRRGFSRASGDASEQAALATAGGGGAAFAGGSAKEVDTALDAAREALKARPAVPAGEQAEVSGAVELRGAYGKPVWSREGTVYSGRLRGVQSGEELRGTWEEEGGSRGSFEIAMSDDGLSFAGRGALRLP